MYIPAFNRVTDEPTLWALMREFNFALLISSQNDVPFATPVPFTLDEPNRRLSTHVARANPQWQHLSPDRDALIVFQAEHALVSPRWYEQAQSVPTWNYATVHAYARPRVMTPDELRAQLTALMAHHAHADDMAGLSEEYLAGMQKGIVGLEFTDVRLEGKFKLSQNKTARDQHSVASHLERQGELERGIAARMRENLPE